MCNREIQWFDIYQEIVNLAYYMVESKEYSIKEVLYMLQKSWKYEDIYI